MNTLFAVKITIAILVIFTILSVFRLKEEFNRVTDESVVNFLRYPGEQKKCPHMPNNMASRVFTVPDLDFRMKLCCSGCFSSILREVNNDGIYSISELSLDDIEDLEKYHSERNLEFPFPDLNPYLGRVALFKNNMPFIEVFYRFKIFF